TVTVKSTQDTALTITGAEAGGGFRNEVHPVLVVPANEATGCSAIGSVEVFNSTSGQTTLFAHPILVSRRAAKERAVFDSLSGAGVAHNRAGIHCHRLLLSILEAQATGSAL